MASLMDRWWMFASMYNNNNNLLSSLNIPENDTDIQQSSDITIDELDQVENIESDSDMTIEEDQTNI